MFPKEKQIRSIFKKEINIVLFMSAWSRLQFFNALQTVAFCNARHDKRLNYFKLVIFKGKKVCSYDRLKCIFVIISVHQNYFFLNLCLSKSRILFEHNQGVLIGNKQINSLLKLSFLRLGMKYIIMHLKILWGYKSFIHKNR